MELIDSKGFVCLFESMDLPTMCHKSRLKAVKGDAVIENKVQARHHPSKLADFTFCSSNQKGVKSVEAVPERMFPFRVLDVLDRILLFRVFGLFGSHGIEFLDTLPPF